MAGWCCCMLPARRHLGSTTVPVLAKHRSTSSTPHVIRYVSAHAPPYERTQRTLVRSTVRRTLLSRPFNASVMLSPSAEHTDIGHHHPVWQWSSTRSNGKPVPDRLSRGTTVSHSDHTLSVFTPVSLTDSQCVHNVMPSTTLFTLVTACLSHFHDVSARIHIYSLQNNNKIKPAIGNVSRGRGCSRLVEMKMRHHRIRKLLYILHTFSQASRLFSHIGYLAFAADSTPRNVSLPYLTFGVDATRR